jgi:hypothetical protein
MNGRCRMIAPTRHAASRPVWESGKAGGNETIRVSHDGRLRVKTPGALADQWGAHVSIAAPVRFSHHGDQWAARVAARRAVRYDIVYDPTRGRWYLDASWAIGAQPAPDLEELRQEPVLGVDLNDGHLDACVLDASGNPVGEPVTIAAPTTALAASRRDGRIRAAITALLDHAQHHGCGAIVVENLDFADTRATGANAWAAAPAANGCAAPWPASPPAVSASG